MSDPIGYRIGGKVYHPADVTIIRPEVVRRVGELTWFKVGLSWEAWHDGRTRTLIRHRRRDGHVSANGWYLGDWNSNHLQWAGSAINDALKVATVLVLGEWWRSGRERDGTPTWRNRAGDVQREPDLLAGLKVRRA